MSFFSEIVKTVDNTFDKLTRITNDPADETQRAVFNSRIAGHQTTNYLSTDCSMKKTIGLATTQPAINYSGGGKGVGAGGCNIGESSELLIGGAAISKSKCKLSLNPRQYQTVPYLGRGAMNLDVNETMRHGEVSINRKSHKADAVADGMFREHSMYPLIPEVAVNIQNPNRMLEESAANGWIRGGISSREIVRQSEN
jgi:hypothetical protein